MPKVITNEVIKELKPGPKLFEIRDANLKGFLVRVFPSGVMTYAVQFGRGKRMTVGRVGVLTPAQARDEAKKKLVDVYRGIDPREEKRAARAHNFKAFVEQEYEPWVKVNHKNCQETLRKLRAFYAGLGDKKLPEVNAWLVEKWRTAQLKFGRRATGINRDITALKAALSKAVEWKIVKSHPLAGLKMLKTDPSAKVRYLDAEEEKRLMAALEEREQKRREERERFNQWRHARGYEPFPSFGQITDHLKPMVIVALHTGLRRGELFNLEWEDLDLGRALLTVRGGGAKSSKTRHIPLNEIALQVLISWKGQAQSTLVFPGKGGKRMRDVKTAFNQLMKNAKIQDFRFHDTRHDFASKLVMAGVDLNTVRELLGHSDIKMTLRYAHLAPEHKRAAVDKLVMHQNQRGSSSEESNQQKMVRGIL